MISLGFASPAALDGYEHGIDELYTWNPQNWGIIFCADFLLRSEMWDRLAHELQDDGVLA